MRLRAQLLWSFGAGAFVIVVLFGSVAYRIARDAGEQREIAVLAGVAKEKAAALSQRARASGSPLALPWSTRPAG